MLYNHAFIICEIYENYNRNHKIIKNLMLINHTFIRDSEKFFLQKAIEELREKYIKNPPEGMTAQLVKNMSDSEYGLLY